MQRILLILCLVFTIPILNTLSAQCDGGRISTNNGATIAYACVNDGNNDFVSFYNNSLAMTDYVYLITDDNNTILAVTDDAFANFEDAGVGDCRVWGLSFTGDLIAEVGDNAAAVNLASGCFDLTENFISVRRRDLKDSNLMLVSGGQDNVVDIDDNNNSMVMVTNIDGLSENYVYVLQRTNGKIIAINETGIFDLADQVPGTYFVFGYNFSGNILLIPGNNISGSDLSGGCEIKSNDFITIHKSSDSAISGCLAEGAIVTTRDRGTITYACIDNGTNDFIGFENTSIAGVQYQYIITDENNIILGLPESGFSNFEDAGSGDCRVWGLSYQGQLTAEIGDELNTTILADDCFDLSDNFISVIRRQTEETEVSLEDESTSATIDDNAAANLNFINDGDNDADFAYVITRSDDRIIAIVEDNSYDFAFEEPGKYFVYGYSYIGEIQFTVGMEANGSISDGCSEKSDNFIFVRKNTDAAPMPPSCTLDAGTLSSEQPMVTLSGGIANIVASPNGDAVVTGDFDQVFVLTSGPELTILMISPAPLFTVTEPGDFRIHTFVAELNDPASPDFFDGSEIVPGISTAADVLAAIETQDVCADLDAMGVQISVLENTACEAIPGLLFADPSEVPQQFFTFISATEIVPPVIPNGYEVTYFAALGPDKLIVQIADAPAFIVEEAGTYNIFALVAETTDQFDPNFFDLNFIVPGITTFETLSFLLDLSGVCAGLDPLGTNVTVIPSGSASTHEADENKNSLSLGEFEMVAYPNPTIDQLTLRYHLAENKPTDDGRFQIIDFTGKVVQNGVLSFQKGLNEWQFSVADLSSGQYFIRVTQTRLRITTPFLKIE